MRSRPTIQQLTAVLAAAYEVVRGYRSIAACHARGELSPLGKYEQASRKIITPGAPPEYELVGVVVPVALADRLDKALVPFVEQKTKEGGNG